MIYIFEEGVDSTPCYGVEDGLDGYTVHNPACRDYEKSWSGPNSSCIGQSPPPPLDVDFNLTTYYYR